MIIYFPLLIRENIAHWLWRLKFAEVNEQFLSFWCWNDQLRGICFKLPLMVRNEARINFSFAGPYFNYRELESNPIGFCNWIPDHILSRLTPRNGEKGWLVYKMIDDQKDNIQAMLPKRYIFSSGESHCFNSFLSDVSEEFLSEDSLDNSYG